MPRKKWDYNIDEIELTHVHSGDMDNNVFYSYFSSNKEQKKKTLDTMLLKNAMSDLVASIFNGDISDDQLRRITSALTVYDAVLDLTKSSSHITASDLYFAALVNWNVSKGNGTNKIRSYAALQAAHDGMKDTGEGLDYREYIVNGDGEGKFNNEYVTILISPKEYGSKMQINLPIMPVWPKKLGLFRLATERVAGFMTIVGDPENTSHTIPPHLWMTMVEEGMSKRITTKFSKLEGKSLTKLISTDHQNIDEILALNGFQSILHFMNTYTLEFEDDGELRVVGTDEPPEEVNEVNGFEWMELRKMTYYLKSSKYYVVSHHGSAVHILVQ